jgi:ubiquinone/menaquinone biosynthesis C-methylase UbiE
MTTQDNHHFEDLYMHTREKEKRVYTNEQVALLPEISSSHPYHHEWIVRQHSSEQLVRYLTGKRRALNMLEVGCGNGWMAAKLSAIPKATVTGMDINETELNQARAVFKKDNLRFVYDTVREGIFPDQQFDVVVFAACLPYFSSLNILRLLFPILAPNGEIHILDTPFYKPDEVAGARERMKAYYAAMNIPEMGNCYYHHSTEELQAFKPRFLYNPRSFVNRLLRKGYPFPWIVIESV